MYGITFAQKNYNLRVTLEAFEDRDLIKILTTRVTLSYTNADEMKHSENNKNLDDRAWRNQRLGTTYGKRENNLPRWNSYVVFGAAATKNIPSYFEQNAL